MNPIFFDTCGYTDRSSVYSMIAVIRAVLKVTGTRPQWWWSVCMAALIFLLNPLSNWNVVETMIQQRTGRIENKLMHSWCLDTFIVLEKTTGTHSRWLHAHQITKGHVHYTICLLWLALHFAVYAMSIEPMPRGANGWPWCKKLYDI